MIHSTILSEGKQYCRRSSLICPTMSGFSGDSHLHVPGTRWHIELFQLHSGQIPYETFRGTLDPFETELLDLCILKILAREGHNVCATNWGQSLGAGLYEFRINRSLALLRQEFGIKDPIESGAENAKLMRVFFSRRGSENHSIFMWLRQRKEFKSKEAARLN